MRASMKACSLSSDVEEEIFHSLQHSYNFLKHASTDFSVENDFSVEYIVMTIYTSIHSYKELFGALPAEMKVFYGIVQSWRVRWWESTPDYEERLQMAHRMGLVDASREQFCEFGRRLLAQAWEQHPS